MKNLILSVLDEAYNFIKQCSDDPTKRAKYIKDKKFFTRKRILTFHNIVGIILSSYKSDIVTNLERYFGRDETYNYAKVVSKSAFAQQRIKLDYQFFIDLLEVMRDAFYRSNSPKLKKWKEWIPAAIDGTRISLPDTKETREEFGEHRHAKGEETSVIGRASFTCDIANDLVLTGHLVNPSIGEHELALEDIQRLSSTEYLYVLDRGYCSFFMLYFLMAHGNKFVCRAKTNLIKSVKDFLNLEQNDGDIMMQAYSKAVSQLSDYGYTVKLGQSITLRAVKIKLSSGVTEVLLTNLTPEEASISELGELYNLRWKEEVAIGIMKNEQQIEIFTGVRVDCIRQDFFGTLFMYNYERLLEKMDEDHIQQINEEHKKKGEDPVSIDHNECWYSTKENFKFWFNAKDIGSSNRAILDFLPAYEKYRYSVREGRKFPRIFRVIKLFGKYKTLNNYRAVV